MRDGWKSEPLGDLFETITGGTPPKREKHLYGDFLPFVKPPELHNGPIISASDNLSREGAAIARVLPVDSILVSCIGNLGKIGINDVPVAFNQQINAIKPSRKVAEPRFIFYQTMSPVFLESLERNASGTTVPIVNKSKFKSIPVVLPPLSEQKRIVAILDEAFEGIGQAVANAEKNLANAHELFVSYLNSVFTQKGKGWVEKKLAEAVTSVSTGPFGSMLHKSDYIDGGTPIVNPINILGGRITPNNRKTVNKETVERLKTYSLDVDDIVIARRGEIGRCAVVEADQVGWICGTGCFYIKPSKELNPYFLVNLLRSTKYREELESVATGATMKNLSNTRLQNLMISFPPSIEDQYDIIFSLDELATETKSLEAIYQQKLTALAELKQSLLQKAFAGELTSEPEIAIKEEAMA